MVISDLNKLDSWEPNKQPLYNIDCPKSGYTYSCEGKVSCDLGLPSICCEHDLLSLINEEVAWAYSRAEYNQAG